MDEKEQKINEINYLLFGDGMNSALSIGNDFSLIDFFEKIKDINYIRDKLTVQNITEKEILKNKNNIKQYINAWNTDAETYDRIINFKKFLNNSLLDFHSTIVGFLNEQDFTNLIKNYGFEELIIKMEQDYRLQIEANAGNHEYIKHFSDFLEYLIFEYLISLELKRIEKIKEINNIYLNKILKKKKINYYTTNYLSWFFKKNNTKDSDVYNIHGLVKETTHSYSYNNCVLDSVLKNKMDVEWNFNIKNKSFTKNIIFYNFSFFKDLDSMKDINFKRVLDIFGLSYLGDEHIFVFLILNGNFKEINYYEYEEDFKNFNKIKYLVKRIGEREFALYINKKEEKTKIIPYTSEDLKRYEENVNWVKVGSHISNLQVFDTKIIYDHHINKDSKNYTQEITINMISCRDDEKKMEDKKIEHDIDSLFWEKVESTNIERIAYIKEEQKLFVEFKKNRIYKLENVPQNLYDEFLASESKGRYYHRVF